MSGIFIRRACYDLSLALTAPENADVFRIRDLLDVHAAKRRLLPRSAEDIFEKIANFRIAELDGTFAGCAALRDYGDGLYEIRSLAAREEMQGRGVGSALISSMIGELKGKHAPGELFVLTYRVPLFERLGFRVVNRALFPQKIWSDCKLCPHAEHCDETALLMEVW